MIPPGHPGGPDGHYVLIQMRCSADSGYPVFYGARMVFSYVPPSGFTSHERQLAPSPEDALETYVPLLDAAPVEGAPSSGVR